MVAQFGAWSAIVSVGGELFQASAVCAAPSPRAAGWGAAGRWGAAPGQLHAAQKVAKCDEFYKEAAPARGVSAALTDPP